MGKEYFLGADGFPRNEFKMPLHGPQRSVTLYYFPGHGYPSADVGYTDNSFSDNGNNDEFESDRRTGVKLCAGYQTEE
ncbi:MAG: hypothetical protein AAF353_00270 [Pseudomonadota bacterium]